MKKFLLLFYVVILVNGVRENKSGEGRIVDTPQGPIRGYKDVDTNLFIFYGVPYATSPKGEHKFRAPLPPPQWQDTFDAVDNKIVCPQSPLLVRDMDIDENCLIANIFLPDTKKTNLPVLVYIHGGAFQLGSGLRLTPKALVNNSDVIAVTFNYRLGIHGFLCLGTENSPGNAGLKDQLALLRWVQNYIASFGGNPDDVTIAGYSAGSMSAELLILSPPAKGLFHKAILESGSSFGVAAVQIDPLEMAKAHAKSMNFDEIDDVYRLEKFYTSSSYDQLTARTYLNKTDATFGFVPCIEREGRDDAFLTDTPFNILKSKKFTKVPILYGITNMEGLLKVNYFGLEKGDFELVKDRMNEKFSDFLPADLEFNSEEQKEKVAKRIKEFYFRDKDIGEDTLNGYIDYYTDILFAYPTLKAVELQVAAGNDNIYLYEFSFVESDGTPTGYKNVTVEGANHVAQSRAVLDGVYNNPFDENLIRIRKVLRELWYNFISKGQPVPESSSLPSWPPVTEQWSPHMSIGNHMELKGSLLMERGRFWDSIYEQHYRQPKPPPPLPKRRTEF